MQIIINKYESKDEDKFRQLLSLCYEEEYLINIVNSSKSKFAYSAFFGNQLVGIMIAWTNSFHPYCTYFKIISNPYYKSVGIEEKLFSKVKEIDTANLPLQTSIWETSANVKKLYENNGFVEIRRTYMPLLRVTDVKDELSNNNKITAIKSLEEVLSNEVLIERLTHIVKRNYENTHLVNPVVEQRLCEWKEMIFADDTVLSGSYIYLDTEEKDILAYSILHESDKESTLELGWCGTSESENIELIPQLIYQQIRYAYKHDIQFIIGEFDTTDKYGMEVLSTLPFAPCPTLITYQKK